MRFLIRTFLAGAIPLLVGGVAVPAAADSLLESSLPVARHVVQRSSYRFVTSVPLAKLLDGKSTRLPPGIAADRYRIQLPSTIFTSHSDAAAEQHSRPIAGLEHYDPLPACGSSTQRRAEIPAADDGFAGFDLLIIDPVKSGQAERAGRYKGRSIEYLAGHLINPYREPSDHAQQMLRLLNLRCLPTRVALREENGRKYLNYWEGESAWGATPASKQRGSPKLPAEPGGGAVSRKKPERSTAPF